MRVSFDDDEDEETRRTERRRIFTFEFSLGFVEVNDTLVSWDSLDSVEFEDADDEHEEDTDVDADDDDDDELFELSSTTIGRPRRFSIDFKRK